MPDGNAPCFPGSDVWSGVRPARALSSGTIRPQPARGPPAHRSIPTRDQMEGRSRTNHYRFDLRIDRSVLLSARNQAVHQKGRRGVGCLELEEYTLWHESEARRVSRLGSSRGYNLHHRRTAPEIVCWIHQRLTRPESPSLPEPSLKGAHWHPGGERHRQCDERQTMSFARIRRTATVFRSIPYSYLKAASRSSSSSAVGSRLNPLLPG